jgi:hypothetical protein
MCCDKGDVLEKSVTYVLIVKEGDRGVKFLRSSCTNLQEYTPSIVILVLLIC